MQLIKKSNFKEYMKFPVKLPTSDFRLPTSDFRLLTSDFRLPTSDFRLPTSDFRLPTSNKIFLPTKLAVEPKERMPAGSRHFFLCTNKSEIVNHVKTCCHSESLS